MDSIGVRHTLDRVIKDSEILKIVKKLKHSDAGSRIFGKGVRPLNKNEIHALEDNGNLCRDWAGILVAENFIPRHIHKNYFHGKCILGHFTGIYMDAGGGIHLPSGIYGSSLADSEAGSESLIYNCGIISGYIITGNSSILNTDSITARGMQRFGNGIEIPLGMESGGREITSFADITIPIAAAASMDRMDNGFIEYYREKLTGYMDELESPFGVICGNSIIRNTGSISGSFIGEYVNIDGAQAVINSTVLGGKEETTEISHGAFISNSCIQWGSSVTSMGIVDGSVLTEHAHVERHGKVIRSILGPNTGVAGGEVTSSLLGPFVGFHHQSMVIAALWPEGKGNVGYGANIGSNHTSRAPDQEIVCGEGIFFGLGVNIKYPSNFSKAPYSIIATAVETLPQRMTFPFSLINKPGEIIQGLQPAINEIFPAWVLGNNMYAVLRNEEKYGKRNRARRTAFDFRVFRPEILDMMIDARDRLANPERSSGIYTAETVEGLGKNYMTEESRMKGMESYNFYIEFYALKGLLGELAGRHGESKNSGSPSAGEKGPDASEIDHARGIMDREGFSKRTVRENMDRLMYMIEAVSLSAFTSKERDDIRGRKIIDDYDRCHVTSDNDPFIAATRARCMESVSLVKRILDKLEA